MNLPSVSYLACSQGIQAAHPIPRRGASWVQTALQYEYIRPRATRRALRRQVCCAVGVGDGLTGSVE